MAILRRRNRNVGGGDFPNQPNSTASYASGVGDLTVGDYANGMPNIRLSEMFKSFGRQLRWLLPMLLIGMIAAWVLTKDFKRVYTGEGRILVQLGDEYVYQSATGQTNQAGLQLTPDTIVLNEVGIIKNSEIIDQVIGEMTATQADKVLFDKEAFSKIASAKSEKARQEAYMELRKTVDNAFVVIPRPKSSVVDLVYKHESPDVAVRTLNAFIDAYMSYRRQIFVEGSGDIITERRRATQEQLSANERAIANFLSKNNISDFTSEQDGARERTEELRASLNLLRAQIAETETALSTVEGQLRGTDQRIDLYVDDRASQRLAQTELELKQLLARYLPTSNPVRQKEVELQELRNLLSASGGKAAGGRRVGPNPVHQALLTRRNTLQATADSYREKEFTLQRQLDGADSKVRRLTALNPNFQNLLRERDTLSTRLDTYNSKEQEALINQEQAEANSENIRIISYAKYPNKGRNMRLVMFALATIAWGFTLFMLALLKVFLDPKLYANPGPRTSAALAGYAGMGHQIPEPVAPMAPAAEPYMPAVQPAAATYEGQEYAQAGYQGYYGEGNYTETYPTQGYSDGYAPQHAQAVGEQVAGTVAQYAQDPYALSSYDQGGGNQDYAQPNMQQSYQAPNEAIPSQYVEGQYQGTGYIDGNAALDMKQNPYLSGKIQAGSIDEMSVAPIDPMQQS